MDEFGMYFFRYLVLKTPLLKKREAFVFFKIVMVMIETESSGGVVVRALAFHQCGGFSPGTPVFPSPQKPAFN